MQQTFENIYRKTNHPCIIIHVSSLCLVCSKDSVTLSHPCTFKLPIVVSYYWWSDDWLECTEQTITQWNGLCCRNSLTSLWIFWYVLLWLWVVIEYHCNSCESKLTPTEILYKDTRYTHFLKPLQFKLKWGVVFRLYSNIRSL